MKSYKIVQLEDMLGHVYSGRADVAMIDELIAWLQLRRKSVAAQQGVQRTACPVPHPQEDFEFICDLCGTHVPARRR